MSAEISIPSPLTRVIGSDSQFLMERRTVFFADSANPTSDVTSRDSCVSKAATLAGKTVGVLVCGENIL